MAQSVRHVSARPHRGHASHDLPWRLSLGPHRLRQRSERTFVHLLLHSWTHHDYDLPSWPFFAVVLRELGDCPPPELLELLRQLPRHRSGPRAGARVRQRPQCRPDATGRLVQDARVRRGCDLGESFGARAAAPLQKSEEGEALRTEPGAGQRREQRRRTRHGNHIEAGFDRAGHEARSGIRQQRRARVGYERNVLARGQPLDDLRSGLRLVVLVVRGGGSRYFVVVEQPARVPRVLGQDYVNRAENLDGAIGNVAEVSDRRADEIEPTRYAACSLNFISSCCFGTAPMT